jgi:hypothetical protein
MAKGAVSGNLFFHALSYTINLLQDMPSPPTDLLHALEYARTIEDRDWVRHPSQLIETVAGQASRIQQDIFALQPHQYLAIPCNFSHHATLLVICCDGYANAQKIYSATLHNTGEGFEQYHYSKTCSDGKIRFQTGFEILSIPQDRLCMGSCIAQILSLATIPSSEAAKKLYAEILPQLGGTIAPCSNNPQKWSHAQLGDTCTMLCLLSFIRSQLSQEEYRRFRDYGRLKTLLQAYEDIKSGAGQQAIQTIIAHEMICDLDRSFAKRGIHLSPTLQQTQQQLHAMLSKHHPVPFHLLRQLSQSIKQNIAEGIKTTIQLAQTEHWEELPEFLEAIARRMGKDLQHNRYMRISESDETDCHKGLEEMWLYCKDRILTAQQIYTIASIASLILHSGISLTSGEETFCEDMIYKTIFLKNKIPSFHAPEAQQLLDKTCKKIWIRDRDEVVIPDGLRRIQDQSL